jgi:hypothetical protein
MDKKPNVIPTREQINAATEEKAKMEAYEMEKALVTNNIYSTAVAPDDTPQGHMSAVEMMRQRTENQLQQVQQGYSVQDTSLAEKNPTRVYDEVARQKNEEQMRLRDEQLKKNFENTQNFQRQTEEATNRHVQQPQQNQQQNMESNNYQSGYQQPVNPPTPPSVPPVNNNYGQSFGENPSNINPYIFEISQPNYNSPFDVIPLPSQGKTYKNKKANIRVGYMTTADENILTSPNLLQSGEFLEILINRKILEPELRYKDLLPGDRNAIMIWLRATGYGEMYPVSLLDEKEDIFETDINLNDLKTKEFGAEPDSDGLFSFTLPLSKMTVRFKFLTCGDIDKLEKMVENDKEKGVLVNNLSTYKFEMMLVEVNGTTDRNFIRDFAGSMRIADAKALDNYIDEIESGIDLNIEVATPGGGSIATFLPLNLNFFWPNIRI